MLVVVGTPAYRLTDPAGPAGRACDIALAAAARGAKVEIVGRVGEDAAGEALMIALGRAGVGHVAVLRDPVRPTLIAAPAVADPGGDGEDPLADVEALLADPDDGAAASGSGDGPRLEAADVTLGLSYLTTFSVLIVADDVPADVVPACVERAAFAGARLVVLVPMDAPMPDGLPADATALTAPSIPDDGDFARLVGVYASALDGGDEPAVAFRTATRAAGWEAAEADEPA
jgi:hypothetical protein